MSGDISRTWKPAANPWVIDSACVVPSGQSLTILPGFEIRVDWRHSPTIHVNGDLNATGTAADSILVTAPLADAEDICFDLSTGADLHLHYFRYDPDESGMLVQGCEGQGAFGLSHVDAPLGGVDVYGDGLELTDLNLWDLFVEGSNVSVTRTHSQYRILIESGWNDPGAIQYSSAGRIVLNHGLFELQSTTSDSTYGYQCTIWMDSCTVNDLLDLNALNLHAEDCQFQDIETIWAVDLDLNRTSFRDYIEFMGSGADANFQSCVGNRIQ